MYPKLHRVVSTTDQVVIYLRALSFDHGHGLLESAITALETLAVAILDAQADWHCFFPGLDDRLIQISFHAHQVSVSCILDLLHHLRTSPGILRQPAISACLQEFARELSQSNAVLAQRLKSFT